MFWSGRKVGFSLSYWISLINWANEQNKLKVLTLYPFTRAACPHQEIGKRIIHSTVCALITVTDVNIIIIVIFCSSCSTTLPVHLLPCFDYCSASIILGSRRGDPAFLKHKSFNSKEATCFFFKKSFSFFHREFFSVHREFFSVLPFTDSTACIFSVKISNTCFLAF